MPARGNVGVQTEGSKKFYLRHISPHATLYFGPFPSSELLVRYYDEYGEYLKSTGELDSEAMSDREFQKRGRAAFPKSWWMRALEREKARREKAAYDRKEEGTEEAPDRASL